MGTMVLKWVSLHAFLVLTLVGRYQHGDPSNVIALFVARWRQSCDKFVMRFCAKAHISPRGAREKASKVGPGGSTSARWGLPLFHLLSYQRAR